MKHIRDDGYGPTAYDDDLPDSVFKAHEPSDRWGPFRVGWSDVDDMPRSVKPLGYRLAVVWSDVLIGFAITVVVLALAGITVLMFMV